MNFINWLEINIEYENKLLDRIQKEFGSFHHNYKTKLQQINDLKLAKNKHLKII